MTLLLAAALALVIGIVLLHRSQLRRQQLGLPNGDVFYQDHQGQRDSVEDIVLVMHRSASVTMHSLEPAKEMQVHLLPHLREA